MIVRSKLLLPTLPRGHVQRPRLVRRVAQSPEARLVAIVAPAGFGKTTFLAELYGAGDPPAAVVSLGGDDDEPNRFWAYVGHALAQVFDGIDVDVADALLGPAPPPVDVAIATWINAIVAARQRAVLALDDLHEIREATVLGQLARFIEHLPPPLQVCVATRESPDLPLSRWRAAGELCEVDAEALRLTDDEARRFLAAVVGNSLRAADADALVRGTEGWAAALRLGSAALRRGGSVVGEFDGTHRDIADYLAQQVVARLGSGLAAFLRDAAVLDELSAEACAAVTQCDDAAARLATLEGTGLPVARLDEGGAAYRLHRLVRDHLLATAPAPQRHAAHARAAAHFEASGDLESALSHAAAAHDRRHATDLLERSSAATITRSRPFALLRDVRRLGLGLTELGAPLLVNFSFAAFLTGRHVELRAALTELQRRRAQGELDDAAWAQVCNIRAGLCNRAGKSAQAIALCEEGLACAPDEPAQLTMGLHLYTAVAHFVTGELEAAAAACSRCLAVENPDGAPSFVGLTAQSVLAQVRTSQGRLGEATELCLRGLARCTAHGEEQAPMVAVVQRTLGRVELERGCWDAAKQRFDAALALARSGALADLTAVIQAWLAEWARLTGDDATWDVAMTDLQTRAAGDRWLSRWRAGLTVRRALDRGEPAPALDLEPPTHDEAWLAELRRRPSAEAMVLGRSLLASAQGQGRTTTTVGLLVGVAVAAASRGMGAEADDAIAEALRIAAQGGLVRGFAEFGDAASVLVARAIGRTSVPEPARAHAVEVRRALSQLAALRSRHADTGAPATALSARELEVLSLLADGMTNQQAAARLSVSLATIKTHVNHIFHKLGVRRRTQAIARARELGWL